MVPAVLAAYAIEDAIRAAKAARGVPVAGLKMGLTSGANIAQMGRPNRSAVSPTTTTKFKSGAAISTEKLIHPRVEAETGFLLKRPLRGPYCEVDDVLAATAYLVATVEVIDSRFEYFKSDLKSVIADNN